MLRAYRTQPRMYLAVPPVARQAAVKIFRTHQHVGNVMAKVHARVLYIPRPRQSRRAVVFEQWVVGVIAARQDQAHHTLRLAAVSLIQPA